MLVLFTSQSTPLMPLVYPSVGKSQGPHEDLVHHKRTRTGRGDALQEMVRQQSWQSSMCVGTTITACCSPNPTALPSSQLPGHCTTCLTRLVGITHFVVCSELFLHARASRLGPGKSPLPSGDSGVNTFLDRPIFGLRLPDRRHVVLWRRRLQNPICASYIVCS